MLKFVKAHMATIDGIEIFPIISLIIFFTFFVGMIIYIAKIKKEDINELKNLPLDEDKN
jgi:cbb3-type cytochrome oxidase subunit 3